MAYRSTRKRGNSRSRAGGSRGRSRTYSRSRKSNSRRSSGGLRSQTVRVVIEAPSVPVAPPQFLPSQVGNVVPTVPRRNRF